MNEKAVLTAKENKIGYVTLNRPEANNTFDIRMGRELNEALRQFDSDDDVNVIVVRANGRNFCTGIDVNFVGDKTMDEYMDWVGLMEEMNTTIADMVKPVIASVQGVAAANGVGLVAACDLAIAADTARFGATAVNVGLFCMGPAVPMVKSMGRKRTLEMILTGDIIDAAKAQQYGLVNDVVPEAELSEKTEALARKLADKSPDAIRLGKLSFYKTEDLNYHDAVNLSNFYFATLCTTDSAKEGVYKFLKKE